MGQQPLIQCETTYQAKSRLSSHRKLLEGNASKSYLLRGKDGPQSNNDSIKFSLKSFQINNVFPQIICSRKAAPRHGKQQEWLRAMEFSEHEW